MDWDAVPTQREFRCTLNVTTQSLTKSHADDHWDFCWLTVFARSLLLYPAQMFCLLQSHVSHERQMPYYSWISFHSQYHAPLSATFWVKSNSDCRSKLPVQLDWAQTSQSIHINNVRWWCLEHGIPHDPPDCEFSAVLLYHKLAEGWLSSPHWPGQW